MPLQVALKDRLQRTADRANQTHMPTLRNKTHRPLSIPLPGGKTLHLGPGNTADVAANAVDGARLKKLIEAGEIEVVDASARAAAGPGSSKPGRPGLLGHTAGVSRRGGDR